MLVLKMVALVLSLGLDTFLLSVSLGVKKPTGILRVAVTFALAEALMPLVGLMIGQGAGALIGHWTSAVGGVVLLALAVWQLLFDNDQEDDSKARALSGYMLLITALGISVDELAVGVSIGLIGVPVVWTIVLIAVQAFAFTVLGVTFGRRLAPYLGEWVEKLPGIVLGLLGVSILIEVFR